MEEELLLEMSCWAGEVGRLVASGYGEIVDREMRAEGLSTRSSLIDLAGTSPSESVAGTDDRISFSEILLAPVQRAARYRLLFHSLLNKVPRGSGGRDKVQAALWAAERIVQGVNTAQGFDLEGLRRESVGGEGAVEMGGSRRKREGRSGMGRRVRSMYS